MNIEVLQNISHFGELELLAKQSVEGFITGLHRSPLHGFSVEFAEHRLYNQGESTRHVDWKLYGRTDKLFIKKYEEETNLRCHILLDASSSMHYPSSGVSKLQFSVFSAISLIHLLKRQRDAFSLTTFSDHIEFQSEAKSSQVHQKYILTELEKVYSSSSHQQKTDVAALLHQMAEKIHKRSLVILFSDMMETASGQLEDIFSGLQHLRYRKHEVIVFHVIDRKTELLLDLENCPYRFEDMETGEVLKLNPMSIKTEYATRTGEFYREIKNRCLQFNIDFVKVDIAHDYRDILRSFLIKRERMF